MDKEKIKLLKNLAEQAPGTIYQYQLHPDGSSCFPYASQSIKGIYGFSPQEVREDAAKIAERIHTDDYDQVIDSIRKSAKNLNIWHEEYRVIHPEKGEIWVEGKAKPEKMDDGSVRWHGNIRNITDKVLKKEKIKKQSNRLNMIIEGANIGTWEWNVKTGELVLNEKWAEMLGYKLEELQPTSIKTWEDLTNPDDFENTEKVLENHFDAEKDLFALEFRMRHKDGHWVWIQSRGKVITWRDDNKPLKLFGVHIDITEQKQKEAKLIYNKDSYQTVFDSAPIGIIVEDSSGNIIDVNDILCKESGYSKQELKGSSVLDKFVLPEHHELAEENIKRILNGEELEFDIKTPIKGGKYKHFHLKERNIPLPDGSDGIISMHLDITERKKQQKELEFQHRFQKTLADISSELLEVNSANVDRKIGRSLKKIGQFFEVDRSHIFIFSDDKKTSSNAHAWCSDNAECRRSEVQNIASNSLAWGVDKLSQNEVINIADVSEMEPKAEAEKDFFKIFNVKSAAAVPMFIDNELFGFFGFHSVSQKQEFSSEDIRILKIFTDVITNAFSKYLDDERIRNLTFKDSLTGLYNRRYFENELERLDTKRQLPISIILADINGLKIINDSFGHKKGDKVLIRSAELLKAETRDEDIIARQGGDEFAILLPQTSQSETEKIIARIKKKTRETKEDELTVSIALGSAVKTKIEQNINNVLKEADNNMYQNKLSESKSTKNKIVKGLINSLEVKSDETKEHTVRMTRLAFRFGEKLGLSNSELNRLSLLSTLHDIGKITIEEEILTKPGSLTAEEWKIMKSHTERGYKIAGSSEGFAVVAEEVYSHHERWDGRGYPRELKGKEIPYLARIISIIDAYDVMTNDRPYTKAVSKKEALIEIRDCAGTQFDPELADKFISMMYDEDILREVQGKKIN